MFDKIITYDPNVIFFQICNVRCESAFKSELIQDFMAEKDYTVFPLLFAGFNNLWLFLSPQT